MVEKLINECNAYLLILPAKLIFVTDVWQMAKKTLGQTFEKI